MIRYIKLQKLSTCVSRYLTFGMLIKVGNYVVRRLVNYRIILTVVRRHLKFCKITLSLIGADIANAYVEYICLEKHLEETKF